MAQQPMPNEDHLSEAHYRNWHLVRSYHDAVTTEFEWGVLRFYQAFERWCTQLAGLTGMSDLNFQEICILHVIRMQDRPKTAAVIARQLNRDDIPNVQYSLRKLLRLKLARKVKESALKTFAYEVTRKGRSVTDAYALLRSELLTEQTRNIEDVDRKLAESTRLISLLTGLYDEAARISTTYSPVTIREAAED